MAIVNALQHRAFKTKTVFEFTVLIVRTFEGIKSNRTNGWRVNGMWQKSKEMESVEVCLHFQTKDSIEKVSAEYGNRAWNDTRSCTISVNRYSSAD